MKNDKQIIVDSKGLLTNEDLEAKGYKVRTLDLTDCNKSNYFNPQKYLIKLAEEDPVKFDQVVGELESSINNDKK